MKLHQRLAHGLSQLGVTHLYGLIGDANLFMVNSYVEGGFGRYVACNHEANAVLAALGFAQTTGQTGVATITHGPALTNAVTALTEAAKGGIPLVLLAGDTRPGDRQHLQDIDQRSVVMATGATFVDMRGPDTVLADLERAFRLAAHHRQPVVFNMRADLQWAETPDQAIPCPIPPVTLAPAGGDLLEEAAGMLASAKRPLLLAGRAALAPEARAALVRLAERIQAPMATTLKAQGLFHGEPFDIGVFGNLSHPVALDVIAQSDCILAFGASLSKYTTDDGNHTRGKRVIQVLPDAADNPRMDVPTIRLVGDIAGTADAMRELLDMAEIPPSGATDDDLAKDLAAQAETFASVPAFAATAPGTVDLVPALRRLHQALPAERVLVTDLGRFVFSTWRNMPVTRPQDFVFSAHFGAIGCGTGEAIGAMTAVTDRPTVLVAGDGGFLLSGLSELSVLVREAANIVLIVCNDGGYGAEHIQFTNRQMAPDLSLISPPGFAAMAAAAGLPSVRVAGEGDLAAACTALSERTGPLLIELCLDPHMIEK